MERINYRVRKTTLAGKRLTDDVSSLTSAERLAMVWEITKDTWAFMGRPIGDTRMQRHVVRVFRRDRRSQ